MIVNLIERIYSFLWGDLLQIPLPGGGSVGISLLIILLIPFYISLKDLKTVKIPQEDGKKKKEMEGIAYNVPGQAMVTLTDGKKKLYEGEIPVTQFGIIEYLAPVLFNKNSTIKVYFDPVTGGLLKVDREESK